MPLLEEAITVACIYHMGQLDKAGQPYILHPLAVMLDPSLTTDKERTIAVLHDVLEDTRDRIAVHNAAENDLYKLFRNNKCPELEYYLDLLTHKSNVRYLDYIREIKTDPTATKIKIADIRHNTSPGRLNHLPPNIQQRLLNKYKKALDILLAEA